MYISKVYPSVERISKKSDENSRPGVLSRDEETPRTASRDYAFRGWSKLVKAEQSGRRGLWALSQLEPMKSSPSGGPPRANSLHI